MLQHTPYLELSASPRRSSEILMSTSIPNSQEMCLDGSKTMVNPFLVEKANNIHVMQVNDGARNAEM